MNTCRSIITTLNICGGMPRIENTHITVEVLVRAFMAGNPIRKIAADYDLQHGEVEAAIRFHARQVHARRRVEG